MPVGAPPPPPPLSGETSPPPKTFYATDCYLSVNDIFDNQHISAIVNFANHTKRLIVPEELDQIGVTSTTHTSSQFTFLFNTQLPLNRLYILQHLPSSYITHSDSPASSHCIGLPYSRGRQSIHILSSRGPPRPSLS